MRSFTETSRDEIIREQSEERKGPETDSGGTSQVQEMGVKKGRRGTVREIGEPESTVQCKSMWRYVHKEKGSSPNTCPEIRTSWEVANH